MQYYTTVRLDMPQAREGCVPFRDGCSHIFLEGDVTCCCGRYPSELGMRAGLREVPSREPIYYPRATIETVWARRAREAGR